MLQVKLPYYPEISATATINKLGLQDISVPEIYEKPLPNKLIIRVDLLQTVPKLDVNNLNHRNTFYNLLTLELSKDAKNKIFHTLYDKSAEFRYYIKELYIFGDTATPLETIARQDTMNHIKEVRNTVIPEYDKNFKYLVETNGYVYYSINNAELKLEDRYGVQYIC